jgi:hypothetical protein
VKLDGDALRAKIKAIAESMTAKNWQKKSVVLVSLTR